MGIKHQRLNIGWGAEPNAPEVVLKVEENRLRVVFFLNPFIYKNVDEGDKGELLFTNCFQYSFNNCNDEGYFSEQYRYKNKELPWGEFYELNSNWKKDFHPEYHILTPHANTHGLRHFIFFFRDNTLECVARDFEFRYLRAKTGFGANPADYNWR